MKYTMVLAIALGCISLESECGWWKDIERNVSKNNERAKEWFHREAQPEANRIGKNIERNVSKNNKRVKEWFHREAQPELDRIGENLHDLWNRLSCNDDNGVDEDIQTVESSILSTEKQIEKNPINEISKDNTDSAIELAELELQAAEDKLQVTQRNRDNAIAKAEAENRDLTKVEDCKLKLEIAQARYERTLKKVEVLKLRKAFQDAIQN